VIKNLICLSLLLVVAGYTCADEVGRDGVFNYNSTMDLGSVGDGVPGYRYVINRLRRKVAAADIAKSYLIKTSDKGKPGNAMFIPHYAGVNAYQVELNDIYIHEDCEVEISFDARFAENLNSEEMNNNKFKIDFRCMPNLDLGERYYPMLNGINFRPTNEWKKFSKRFKVKKQDNFYNVWITAFNDLATGDVAGLYVDNFFVRVVAADKKRDDEVAVIPDNIDSIYMMGEEISLKVRALLNSNDNSAKIKLTLVADHSNDIVKTFEVDLQKQESDTGDSRKLYTGMVKFKPELYGSFVTDTYFADNSLKTVGGDYVVLHEPVRHPRLSPGWRIGYNSLDPCPRGRTRATLDYTDYYFYQAGRSIDDRSKLARLAGMNLTRFWGTWRYIEPKENEFRSDVVGPFMDSFKNNNIDVMFIVAGVSLSLHGNKDKLESYVKSGKSMVPPYLNKYYFQAKRQGSIQPPVEVYERFLDYIIKAWGKDIAVWELFNEPGLGQFSPQKYIDYLKVTYKDVKAKFPEAQVLGNGVTGDFGMNVVGWCEDLNKADPNYVDYLDGIAFHPYAGELDYRKGQYFLHTQTIANIANTLKKKKPLWNTECYYILNSRKPQKNFGMNLSEIGASEMQRHHLEGISNGLMGITAITENSLYKRKSPVTFPAPSQAFAAGNALSYMLKGMDDIEVINRNKYIKAGVFYGKGNKGGVGFIYDLRPSGSDWDVSEANKYGVDVFDLYGNKVSAKKAFLTYEPFYVKGEVGKIKEFLSRSKLMVKDALHVNARIFDDRIFIEGKNLTGAKGVFEIRFSDVENAGIPAKIFMNFNADAKYSPVSEYKIKRPFPDKIKWSAYLNGDEIGGGETAVAVTKNTHHISNSEDNAELLTLSAGSTAKIWSEDGLLNIAVSVEDKDIVAAKDSSLWTGDAVEVFIDADPFNEMDRNEITNSAGHNLNVYQYIFPVKPALDGTKLLLINKITGKQASAALVESKLNDNGYTITAKIPWSEIKFTDSINDIVGFDIEIDKIDSVANKVKTVKESLGNNPGKSYAQRSHYKIFRLPQDVIEFLKKKITSLGGSFLDNSEFLNIEYGDVVDWSYAVSGGTTIKGLKNSDDKAVVLLSRDKNSDKVNAELKQELEIIPASVKKVIVQILARSVAPIVENKDTGLTVEFVYYTDKRKNLGHEVINYMFAKDHEDLNQWTELQYVFSVPSTAARIVFNAGMTSKLFGSVELDRISIRYVR